MRRGSLTARQARLEEAWRLILPCRKTAVFLRTRFIVPFSARAIIPSTMVHLYLFFVFFLQPGNNLADDCEQRIFFQLSDFCSQSGENSRTYSVLEPFAFFFSMKQWGFGGSFKLLRPTRRTTEMNCMYVVGRNLIHVLR